MSREFENLLADYFDGAPDAGSLSRMSELLGRESALRDRFRREVRMHVLFREIASEALAARQEVELVPAGPGVAAVRPPSPTRRRSIWRGPQRRRAEVAMLKYVLVPLAAAAVVLLAYLLGRSNGTGRGDHAGPAPRREVVERSPAVETPAPAPARVREEPLPEAPSATQEPSVPVTPQAPEEPPPEPAVFDIVEQPVEEAPPPTAAEIEPFTPELPAPPTALVEKPEPPAEKAPAVARLERASGRVFVFTDAMSSDAVAEAGQEILEGQTVLAVGAANSAIVVFPDSTRIEMAGDSEARYSAAKAKAVFLAKGELVAMVAPQAKGRPMTVTTPHAEVQVLGTMFSVRCDAASTRLRIDDGVVQFTCLTGGRRINLPAGYEAVATKGGGLAAKPFLGPNMVKDPGFEKNAQGWQVLKGRTGKPAVGPVQVHSGQAALQVPQTECSPCVIQYAKVRGGATYEVIGWVKAGNAEAEIAIVFRKHSGIEYWGKTVIAKVKGATGWTRVHKTVTAPTTPKPQSVKIVLSCGNGPAGTGSVWFDDIYFGETIK